MTGTVRLGGMAMQNGVLVHGPTSWGAAVRDAEGGLHVASGAKPRFADSVSTPILRGPLRLAESSLRAGSRSFQRRSRSVNPGSRSTTAPSTSPSARTRGEALPHRRSIPAAGRS
jgi:uncharacterized protein YqhQ